MTASKADPATIERAVAELRTPAAIRKRCGNILTAALANDLRHFAVDLDRLPAVAERVIAVTRKHYPTLDIPYHSRWNHFRTGGVDRLADIKLDPSSQLELVILSVLLDAGAGPRWRYDDAETRQTVARSEGLAVASLRMFLAGQLTGDAESLIGFENEMLAEGFQSSPGNPLVGVEGRAQLLRSVGRTVADNPEVFGEERRLGGLFSYLEGRATDGKLRAADLLGVVLEVFGSIWPGRTELAGVALGDVWPHPAAGGEGPGRGLVPFHKLSQWLTYSLIEPLCAGGVEVTDVDELTGLAEYRNGGLLFDMNAIKPKHEEVTARVHRADSTLVVEWRALTVALLDRLADAVREELGLDRESLPLARVLEGGTWSAGREVARECRVGGTPPIKIESDGTIF